MIYKFTITQDIKLPTDLKGKEFKSKWLKIEANGDCTITKGYSWDGCSPKVKIFGKIIGTPDGKSLGDYPITYFASMLHDVLYQNKSTLPFSRLEVDQEFKNQLIFVGFEFTNLYYFFVRKFGGLYGTWKTK